MKGFAITPLLFVGLFAIAGIMLLSFGEMERKTRDSIEKQSLLRSIGSAAIENYTSEISLLYFASVSGTVSASTQAELEANITRILGKTAKVTDCRAGYFTSSLDHSFVKSQKPASVNDTRIVFRKITCADIYSLDKDPVSITCVQTGVFSCL